MLEDHLPDFGVSFLLIGGILFMLGYTLTLNDDSSTMSAVKRWPETPLTHWSETPVTHWPETPFRQRDKSIVAYDQESIATPPVDLAEPIFKFVKVFPYHKHFSGTPDFPLNAVKMKLIIQFNKTTQTH